MKTRLVRFVCFLSISFLMGNLRCVAAPISPQGSNSEIEEASRGCWDNFDQSKYFLIRNKIKFSPWQDAASVNPGQTVPTTAEAKQIASLVPLALKCYFAPPVTPFSSDAQDLDMLMPFVARDLTVIGALDLLASRQITYSQFALISDTASESAKSAFAKRIKRESPAPQSAEPIRLSCTVKMTGQFAEQNKEVEFQFAIDPATNTATASRGGRPTDLSISPTGIVFRQADSIVNISRTTGRFDISSPNAGIIFSGVCEAAATARF